MMPAFTQQQVKEMEFAMQIKSILSNASFQFNLTNPTSIVASYNFQTGEIEYEIDPVNE